MFVIRLKRIASNGDTTVGHLSCEGFEGFCIEDEYRAKKIMNETRIPAGLYEIKLRKAGGFHTRYSKKFGSKHKGMLWLQNVPNFKWIYIHPGNTDDDTSGCLLPNLGFNFASWYGNTSSDAYWQLYDIVIRKLAKEQVVILIEDEALGILG